MTTETQVRYTILLQTDHRCHWFASVEEHDPITGTSSLEYTKNSETWTGAYERAKALIQERREIK